MRNKIMKVFLAMIITVPMIFPVFGITQEELLERLNGVIGDVEGLKSEYTEMLNTYSDVIESLSEENKEAIKSLHTNLTADNLKETVVSIKEELAASTNEDAAKVLDTVEKLESDAKTLINENKDLIEEVKTSYSDMSTDELQEVIEKVKDVAESLGYETDTTETYNSLRTILDEAHAIALGINDDIEEILKNNHHIFNSALTTSGIKSVLKAVKTQDIAKVITAIKDTLNGVEGGETLKQELATLKNKAVTLKNKLQEVRSLDEADLLMLTEEQVTAISNKIKGVEADYVTFIKLIINDYLEMYLESIIEFTYDIPIDTAIRYANDVLDYTKELEKMSFNTETIVEKLPDGVAEDLGLIVALGFVDIDRYNKEYITGNFGTEIDNIINFLGNEVLDYLVNLETRFENELDAELNKQLIAAETQTNIKLLTTSRFNTLNSLKELRDRAEKEILSKVSGVMDKIERVEPLAYDIFYKSVLNNIEMTMKLENGKTTRAYEANLDKNYILTNVFETASKLHAKFGIPSENKDVLFFTNLAGSKVKTASTMLIELSEGIVSTYTYVVLGDVYADGNIDARDYMMIKNYIMGSEEMNTECELAADTFRDSSIDARDYMKIKNKIMEDEQITL